MLAVVDYGAGNLRSVIHALRHLDAHDIEIVRDPTALDSATSIILPGVGAFGAGMRILNETGLAAAVIGAVRRGVPYLGICLGMQFLFDSSDEMGTHSGLGLLEGQVTRFSPTLGLKIPHMGWNQVGVVRDSPIFRDLPGAPYAYFVHSYYCVPTRTSDITATVDYGGEICVAVQRDHIFGVQFHPEKSQTTGLKVLSNFLNFAQGATA
ncbi:MAG: imidazole glycerol phosphate synthase subunit HisH [Anaerolineae bacterium]|nr:MAG: imidazole glycerol phosphate synthase subunit HisH [Chloroflexi bacterium OLB13]MBW7878231.1 imidazole glycerol phosphate synthase subunit HisH [Anaerolineae bacterium]GIK29109.1 MAG: imidazole glycerol phosphate synthase subunit HisH [Chloroflexota bacterium]